LSFGIYGHAVRWKSTIVSEKRSGQKIKPKRKPYEASRKSLLLPDFFLGLFFDPEYGGSTFLRNVGERLLNCIPEDSFLHSQHCENLKSSVR
jgi:hypothetical protein